MALNIGGMIGGSGGSYFSFYGGTDGRVMSRITVWAARNCIKAIRVWLSGGAQRTFGIPERNSDSGNLTTADFIFEAGELVTSLSLWGNGIGYLNGFFISYQFYNPPGPSTPFCVCSNRWIFLRTVS